MKIVYAMLLLLISVFSARAQLISVSAPSFCSTGNITVTATSPGGNASAGAVWYMVADTRNPWVSPSTPFIITNCAVIEAGGDPAYEYEWDAISSPSGTIVGQDQIPSSYYEPFARISSTGVTGFTPCTITAPGTGQTIQYFNYSNPLTLTNMASGTYTLACVLNGQTYYSAPFTVNSNIGTNTVLCGQYAKGVGYHVVPPGQFINSFGEITMCTTPGITYIYSDPNNITTPFSGDLHIRAEHDILLNPTLLSNGTSNYFLAEYGSNFVAVIGAPCDADTYRAGDFAETNTASQSTSSVPTFLVYPNPSSGVFNISSDANIDAVEVTNSLGEIIIKDSKTQIDLSNQSEGLYFFKISSNGQTVMKKVIKK